MFNVLKKIRNSLRERKKLHCLWGSIDLLGYKHFENGVICLYCNRVSLYFNRVSDGNDKTDDETIQVEINIKDSNTQSPKFKTGVSYEASVKETAEIGKKL
jgi:hypothetical protein